MIGMTKHDTNVTQPSRLNRIAVGSGGTPEFGFRRSTFVISATVFVIASTLALTGCSNKRITKANVDEVAENMSKKQVESILGPPTESSKTRYVYRQENGIVTITFKDDKLQSKESTLSD